MDETEEVPDWLAHYVRRIRECLFDAEMFEARELPDERRDALAERDAIVRYIARRLSGPVL